MSNDNLPTLYSSLPEDFSESEKQLLQKFKDDGFPGISSVPHEIEKRMEEMYMEGYSYRAISLELRHKKVHVLALANKNKWLEKRNERLVAMAESIYTRKDIFLSQNQHFLITLCDSIKEYYSDKIKQFKSSKDASILGSIDPKLVNLYLKCLDTLAGTGTGKVDTAKSSSQTLVNVQGNLNVGENKNNTDDLGKVLKALADLNRIGDNNKGESDHE